MTDMEILQLADQCGVVAITKHEWDGKQFNHTDDYLDGDAAALVIFAKLVAEHERERILEMCKEGLWDGDGIRLHLEQKEAIECPVCRDSGYPYPKCGCVTYTEAKLKGKNT